MRQPPDNKQPDETQRSERLQQEQKNADKEASVSGGYTDPLQETSPLVAEKRFQTAEKGRIEAEEFRKIAELERVKGEEKRISEERQRGEAELRRRELEASRDLAESARNIAEKARLIAEAARVQAESDREEAEASLGLAQSGQELAEKANLLKSKALANMSHELRTPLNAIIGYSQMLQQHQNSSLSEKEFRFVENINTSAQHLLRMINDILDIAKIEAGKLSLALEQIVIFPLVYQAVESVRPFADAKHVTIEVDCPPDLGQAEVDPSRLTQILLNLLTNAIKFNRTGGSVCLTLFKSQDNQWLIGQIVDTGIGIPKQQLESLFQEFYQVIGSETLKQEGSGLGLSLVKSLVELHGGTISVTSEEGVGSAFTFKLPVSHQQPA